LYARIFIAFPSHKTSFRWASKLLDGGSKEAALKTCKKAPIFSQGSSISK
jgi:hypothetical protein